MEFTYSNDSFLPYDSFDYIFNEREMPEFGKVASPYMKPLNTWRFYLANGQNEIPFGVMNSSFDDSDLFNSRFIASTLIDTSFRNCNLKRTLFYDTKRTNVSFKMSNTREALFTPEGKTPSEADLPFGNSIVDGGRL